MTDLESLNIDYTSPDITSGKTENRFVVFFLYTSMSILNYLLLSTLYFSLTFRNPSFITGTDLLLIPVGYLAGLCLSLWQGRKKGMRNFMLTATILTIVSWWVAYYAISVVESYSAFSLFLMGTALPFFMIPTKLTSLWFPRDERILATSAYFIVKIIVNNLGDSLILYFAELRTNELSLFLVPDLAIAFEVTAIISTIFGALVVLLFKDLPSRFPTASSNFANENVSSCEHLSAKNYLFILFGAAPLIGTFEMFELSAYFLPSSQKTLQLLPIILACLGIASFAIYVNKTGKFRMSLLVTILGTVIPGIFFFLNPETNLLTISVITFFGAPIYPLALELLAETAFPADPVVAGALLFPIGSVLFFIVNIFPIIFGLLVLVGLVLIFNSEDRLNRSNFDEMNFEKKKLNN